MSDQALRSQEQDEFARPFSARNFELNQMRNAIQDIRHGEVRVIIQDGLIIQIDRLEKKRLR